MLPLALPIRSAHRVSTKMSEKTETSDDPMIKLAIVIGKGLYRTVYALKDTLDEVGRVSN